MLDFIRDAEAFLADATSEQAQADCDLTRCALGLEASAAQSAREVWLLAEWLDSHAWWRVRAEDAVRHHCADCPAARCPARQADAQAADAAPLVFA